MYLQSHFNTAALLIKAYDGSLPLVHYLKNYFSQNKKHGSKDRKHISHLCYCYYRLGHSANHLTVEERIKLGLFLCQEEVGIWAALFEEHWLSTWSKDVTERIAFAKQEGFKLNEAIVFPWQDELSEGIDGKQFSLNHWVQPDLFLRIRPKQMQAVLQKLHDEAIIFQRPSTTTISLPNATKVDDLLAINRQVVVQDYSSQKVAAFLEVFKSQITNHTSSIKVWDCCAASGGKSILAKDVLGNIQLTVSDIRESIIRNLKERLFTAGVNLQQTLVMDLASNAIPSSMHNQFELVIADVPCTGSGTWSRTPEQLAFFQTPSIKSFAIQQKRIASHIIPSIKKEGFLLYITCSVFKKENEEVALFLKENCQLELVKMEVLQGYDKKADTMFAALFKKVTA